MERERLLVSAKLEDGDRPKPLPAPSPLRKSFKKTRAYTFAGCVCLPILITLFFINALVYRELSQRNSLQREIDKLEFQKEVLEMKLKTLNDKHSDNNFINFEKRSQLDMAISRLSEKFERMDKLFTVLSKKLKDPSLVNFTSDGIDNDKANNDYGNVDCSQNDVNCVTHKDRSQLPYCIDGSTSGRWVDKHTWESNTCQYRNVSTEELRACLAGKWVHFFGDSLVRLMANEFARKAGMRRTDWSQNKSRNTLFDTATESLDNSKMRYRGRYARMVRVTYLFRAKMAHQRHPRIGLNGSKDLNDEFLIEMENGGNQPNYLVLSIGAHEAIGWNNRPHPDLDIEVFKSDTEELLQKLKRSFTKGKLIWCKAHFIWPGKVVGDDYERVKSFHKAAQEYAFKRFQEEGHLTMDFYQTTVTRNDLLLSGDGVHYGGAVLDQHTKMLAHVMCKPDSS